MLKGMIEDANQQMRVVEEYQGWRMAEDCLAFFEMLLDDGKFIRLTAQKDRFCNQCPKYEEEGCTGQQVIRDDHYFARMFYFQIGGIYHRDLVFDRLAALDIEFPYAIYEKPVTQMLWLDNSPLHGTFGSGNFLPNNKTLYRAIMENVGDGGIIPTTFK